MNQNRVSIPLALPDSNCFGDAPVTLVLTMTETQAVYLLEMLTQKVKEARDEDKAGWRELSHNVVHTLAMSLGEEANGRRVPGAPA